MYRSASVKVTAMELGMDRNSKMAGRILDFKAEAQIMLEMAKHSEHLVVVLISGNCINPNTGTTRCARRR
ncbi:hypothetical protein OK016_25015 [Vibrio chagasii]|nr:hypothetical protein [Vibrio chagasii]